jgi:hypothetical protein
MDLHPTPNNKTGNRMPIDELTSNSSKQTGNRMPIDGLISNSSKQMSKSKHMQNTQANNASHTIYKQEAQSKVGFSQEGSYQPRQTSQMYQVICELLTTNIES